MSKRWPVFALDKEQVVAIGCYRYIVVSNEMIQFDEHRIQRVGSHGRFGIAFDPLMTLRPLFPASRAYGVPSSLFCWRFFGRGHVLGCYFYHLKL